MPTAVAVFFAKAAVAAGVTGAAIKAIAFVGYTLGAIGTSIALQKVSELLLGKPKVPRRAQDVEYNGTVESRRIIYGKMRVSGLNVIPPLTSGNKNKYLHQVLAIAGHEVNNITTVWFNQDAVGTIGSVTGSDNDGLVSTGAYANKAWVRRYKGTDAQTSDYKLTTAFSQWTVNHRGRGVAYLALTYEFDTKVYTTGRPAVTCLVEGKKLYDPRLDSTQTAIGGSGSHRYDDASTFAYSTNPALCLADYLMSQRVGLGEDPANIDWATVADAADVCDENVSIPNGSGGTTTQKRYTCNTVLVATDNFADNIQILAQAMMGACFYSGGKWRVHAGAWSTPAFTLTNDDLIEGGIEVTTALPFNEKYNAVRGRFINADQNYQLLEFPAVVSDTYAISDEGTFYREVEWPSTTNVYEAQRNAKLVLRQSRNNQKATVRCGMSAWKIRPFETGTVTFSELGWTNKTVRCESWKFDPQGFVELVLREDSANSWGDPAVDGDDYGEGQFPAANYFIPLNSITLSSPESAGYADSYFNRPELDAARFNIILDGDNNAWAHPDAYYNIGLPLSSGVQGLPVSGGIIDTALTANNLSFDDVFAVSHPALLDKYYESGQVDFNASPIPNLSPGTKNVSLNGVASIPFAYANAYIYDSPISLSAYFDQNPSKTTTKYFSGYTHFQGEANCSLNLYDPSKGHVARMVFGIVQDIADPATLNAADIKCGLLISGTAVSATAQLVLNGQVLQSNSMAKPLNYGASCIIGNQNANLADRSSSTSPYTQDINQITFVGLSSDGVLVDGFSVEDLSQVFVDTFRSKFVKYIDYVSTDSPVFENGYIYTEVFGMFTHPGWDFDYTDPDNVNNPTPGTNTPDEPTSLQALGEFGGINFSWTPPEQFEAGSIYELYEHASATPFSSAIRIWSGTATSTFITKFDTTTRYYWVRVIDQAGNPSSTEPLTSGVPASATNVSTSLYAYPSTSTLYKSEDAASITTAAVTVSAVGGTPAYAYSWTKLSGDSITITSASAATTTFSAATMISGETRTAIFRCAVTDSASPQAVFNVDIVVTINRPAMSATASPGSLYKFSALEFSTTNSTTVTASGGSGSYTYAWTRLSGGFLTVNSPTSATTTFTANNIPRTGFLTAVYRCTVTDTSSPQKTAFVDVYITFERDSSLDKF